MAIDPTTTTTVKVGELASAGYSTTDLIPHEVGGILKKGNLQDLATFIGEIIDVTGGVGFRAVEVNDGETLPATSEQEFILVGPGTYPNVGGGATITTTGSLNALVSNGTFWFIGVEIPIEVNGIWGDITGVISDQTDLYDILEAKADLVDGKVPNSQLPSYVDDVVEVADYAALPTIGESGKIYVTIDNGNVYRWSGSAYIRIADEATSWGTIIGTLSDQTDLQSALNAKEPTITAGTTGQYWRGDKSWQTLNKTAVGLSNVDNTSDLNKPISTATQTALNGKFNNPTGDTTQYIAGDGTLISFPIAGQSGTLVREVRNTTGATLTKGTVVYISGASGNKPTVAKAIATSDATSAQTFGLIQADISNNSNGYIVCVGDLIDLNTSAIAEGTQLYLSSTTAGEYTTTKQYAPAHLVYIGVVTRSHATQGQIEVKIQNGYELDELHNVAAQTPSNNEVLVYETSTSLWKPKTIGTILGYTPSNDSNVVHKTGNESIAGWKTFTGGITIWDNTSSNLLDFYVNGTEIGSINVGTSYMQFSALNSGGYLFKNNAGVNSLTLTNSGVATFLNSVTATSFIKSGGTSSQFLKADGSVDSSTYASDSLVVKLAGSQTITGSKLFTANTSFQGATIIDYIGGISLKQTGLSLYNQMVAVDGGFNFYENAGTVFSFKIRPEYISFGDSINNAILNASNLTAERTFDLPNASGTIALTSNIPSVSGTTNYIPKFTGASALGNSLIYDNGTNVGIGTTSPSQKLEVIGVAKIVTPTGISFERALALSKAGGYGDSSIENYYTSGSNYGLSLNPGDSGNRVVINQAGNVGIGTTSPATKLHIGGVGSAISFDTTGVAASSLIRTVNDYDLSLYCGRGTATEVIVGNDNFRVLTSSSERMRITSSGNVVVNNLGTGLVYSNAGALTSTNPSDRRLKDNITDLQYGLNEILQLRPVSYDWKNDTINQGKQFGFIAQEVEEIMPELVKEFETEEGTRLGLDKDAIFVTLVNAIKELQQQINELKNGN